MAPKDRGERNSPTAREVMNEEAARASKIGLEGGREGGREGGKEVGIKSGKVEKTKTMIKTIGRGTNRMQEACLEKKASSPPSLLPFIPPSLPLPT